ncbi:hypothetical protein [Rhodoferax sp.]|uniref:hypothetical protein n=1 Tax=Rhodoferax sp. TaxID=50421 RepID=UPI002772BC5E|nr:hypothetical protein [Rhodoferax sp.]
MKPTKRTLLAVMSLLPLAGCTVAAGVSRAATAVGGESASYTILNFSALILESIRVNKPGQSHLNFGVIYVYGGREESSLSRFATLGRQILISVGDSNHYRHSSGHRIPGEVEVSWHEPPAPGGKMYSGPLRGPYRVTVRARIPADVLRQVRSDDYVLCLSFGVGGDTVLLNWALVEYDGQPRFARDRKILKSGGDSFP